jgi:4-amino-4-deoxy-L-arabinose transferase-like glycosyltransferase
MHTSRFYYLLAALTLLRLGVAATVPLAPDETYYWVWSHGLAAGYPDHPPMVALWIRLSTIIAGNTALGIRLLGPLSVAVASLLLADAADCLLADRRAGIRAAILLNATLLLGIGAVIMTPDTPLLVFWTACIWGMARLLKSGDPRWWLAIGLFAGLAMDSKYTAALLWFGIVLWLLVTPAMRRWLRRPAPWFGAAIALAVFLPVVVWNANHGWTSFAQQGGRLGEWQPADAPHFLTELVFGQLGLVTPLIFVFCVGGIVLSARNAWRTRDPAWTLLAALTLPSVILFTQHALGDRVQGNWPAIIYPAAAVAAAAAGLQTPAWQRLWTPSIILGFAITLLAYVQGTASLLPIPTRFDPVALRLAGWDTLAAQVETMRARAGADFIAADQYGVASELAFALPFPVVGIEPRWALFDLPHAKVAGQTGILVHDGGGTPDRTPWSTVTELGAVERGPETLRIYRVTATGTPADARLLARN